MLKYSVQNLLETDITNFSASFHAGGCYTIQKVMLKWLYQSLKILTLIHKIKDILIYNYKSLSLINTKSDLFDGHILTNYDELVLTIKVCSCKSVPPGLKKFRWKKWELQVNGWNLQCTKTCASFDLINQISTQIR